MQCPGIVNDAISPFDGQPLGDGRPLSSTIQYLVERFRPAKRRFESFTLNGYILYRPVAGRNEAVPKKGASKTLKVDPGPDDLIWLI